MASIASFQDIGRPRETALPRNVYRYVLSTSAVHQLALVALTVVVALLEVAPLEIQRRIVNDLVKHRPYSWVIWLCAAYAGVVLVQGSIKLVLNVYRGWVGERAKRDLRHRVHTVVENPVTDSPAAEAQGITISMMVAEVEPVGGFVDESVSEPLLQTGIMGSVFAYLIHIDPWMALAAIVIFVPQLIFVPLLQGAVNRRTGARIRVLRELGIAMIDRTDGADDQYCASFRHVPKRIVLDVDDTFDRVHGGQQLRLFNAFHDDYGFQPIVVFDGEGRFVTALLRPGKRPSGQEIRAFVRRLVGAIRALWPKSLPLA